MKSPRASATSKLIGPCTALLGILSFGCLRADTTVDINFDSVDASAGQVDATAYLASYGITLSNVSPSGSAVIISDQHFYGNSTVQATSENNFLMSSNNSQPNTFTLTFGEDLDSFSFTRIAITGTAQIAGWSATAYDGATELESVSEPFTSTSGEAAKAYSLAGPDITSVVFAANGLGQAGISGAPVDNFVLVEAPEPSVYALMLGGLAVLGFCLRRQGRMAIGRFVQ
jgi:hypothetical protein